MRVERFTKIIAIALLAFGQAASARADKIPLQSRTGNEWNYRVADFFQYSAHSPLVQGGANGWTVQNDGSGNPIPIQSIDTRLGTTSDPVPMDAGRPLALDVFFDTFSNEFQFQIGYSTGPDGSFPNSLAFVVTNGVFPDLDTPQEVDRWALFLVDATDPDNVILTVCPFDPMLEPAGRGPLLTSCLNETPIVSSQRSSDNAFTGKLPVPDPLDATTNPNIWQTGISNPNGIIDQTGQVTGAQWTYKRVSYGTRDFWGTETREFTVNIDATPLLTYFGNAGNPGIGLRGLGIDLTDPNAKPLFGMRSVAMSGVAYEYDANGVLTNVIAPAALGVNFLQTHLQLINVAVNITRCPINCVGDIWGTTGPKKECAELESPVTPPTPPTAPALTCSKQELIDNNGLDGAATGLFELVNFSTKKAKRVSRRIRGTRRLVIRAEENQVLAEAAFIKAWTTSWALPKVTVTCDSGILPADCRVETFVAQTDTYVTSSDTIRQISEDNIRVIRSLRRKVSSNSKKSLRRLIKKLKKDTAEFYDEAISYSKAVPVSSVMCSTTDL
jgi:hypothetical protein